jgi:trk system potassium uptake protein
MDYRPVQPNRSSTAWADHLSSLPVALRLLSGLAGLILIGALLFMLPGMGRRPISFDEALFTSASALTVTGLAVISPARDMTFLGQLLLLVLIQVGGIGLMVFTVIIFRLLGRRVSLVERMALRNVLGSLMPGAVLRLLFQVVAAVLLIEGAGALLLWFQWKPYFEPEVAAWYAIFHSISAFCNSGFDLFTGIPGYDAIPNDSGTLSIFGVLIFIGSLGVPVVADLLALPRDHKLTLHTRLTLAMVAGMLLTSTLVLVVAESVRPGVLAHEPWDRRVGMALFQSVSARTAGFTPLESFESLSPAGQLILMLVMFVGASPASMGGGITTGTAVVLLLALLAFARNRPYPEVGHRTISTETVRRATAVLTISLIIIFVATLLLLLSNPGLSLQGALFEVVSAFATCGLTLAYTPRLNLFGRLLIVLVMVWGRLGALTVIVALTRPIKQPVYYYPEEQILIG